MLVWEVDCDWLRETWLSYPNLFPRGVLQQDLWYQMAHLVVWWRRKELFGSINMILYTYMESAIINGRSGSVNWDSLIPTDIAALIFRKKKMYFYFFSCH